MSKERFMGGKTKRIGLLTSGGDAPGMNAAVRAVIRTALHYGMEIFAIQEGYHGLVNGGQFIYRVDWDFTGGILHQGGTVIGTARCKEFEHREYQRKAAANLLEKEIDRLVVIGGDGSLTGAAIFQEAWPSLVSELAEHNVVSPARAKRHPHLSVVGLVCSIDNDMFGTDMTIGTDTALHRISSALDAINSTAASHQRTFVVEVMGRNCGYLALMGALITGADYVFIPEKPVEPSTWKEEMCVSVKAGREAGRRATIVLVAEGALLKDGTKLSCEMIKDVLETELKADVRITILGHVQRGGSPSAFDRNFSSIQGYAAVKELISLDSDSQARLIAQRNGRIICCDLQTSLQGNANIHDALKNHQFTQVMALRPNSFKEAFDYVSILKNAVPRKPLPKKKRLRFGILHSGATTPGMNSAVRAAVRFCIDKGHEAVGIMGGISGLIEGNSKKKKNISKMDWMSVNGWASLGGANLGTSRKVPKSQDFWNIARNIAEHDIDGLLIIGGWSGVVTAYKLYSQRGSFPVFNIPVICLPATISNNLPGFELSVGTDTAINNIVDAVDKIKQSAVALQRCFIVEVSGRFCGYLALMSGLATGAERTYLHEDGVTLHSFQNDIQRLISQFKDKRHSALIIRNEKSNASYDTAFMTSLFKEECKDYFDVRHAILGHLQHGGNPSPYDRKLATKLAFRCIDVLIAESGKKNAAAALIDIQGGKTSLLHIKDYPNLFETTDADIEIGDHFQRPLKQWWRNHRSIAEKFARKPSQSG
jgi:6-phosphofructokinase 1